MPVPPVDRAQRLAHSLRRLRERLAGLGGEAGWIGASARTGLDRLDRDLLPRTAGGAQHLVAGIVGPNNAGKSALFNALVGATVSPSRPTGGATRRLVGAARAELIARLVADPALARFPLRTVDAGPAGVLEATETGSDAAELLLVVARGVPEGMLLVDTPDFDSVRTENRAASEAFLRVADLALVTVTRHTYQNREVVEFLEAWLSHGRPWLLVYNESIAPAVTVEHAAKLAADVGEEPLATFAAPFDLSVAEGARELDPRALSPAPGCSAPEGGTALGPWLGTLSAAGDLKVRALRSSLAELRAELAALLARLDEEVAGTAAILERGQVHARLLGGRVARETMPIEPFLEAFRAVLDRRPSLLQRGLRGALRQTRGLVERGLARLRGRPPAAGEESARRLAELEARALEAAWAPFFEDLARDLDPARARAGEPGPGDAGEEVMAALAADLAPAQSSAARERARASLGADPEVLAEFRVACEELIAAELDARGSEWFLQLGVDALHLLPALAAGVVIVKTGGLGTDLAVGGAGALSTLFAERLSRLLGSHVARAARERWASLRGARLARAVLDAALPRAAPLLGARAAERGARARELFEAVKEVPWSTTNDRVS